MQPVLAPRAGSSTSGRLEGTQQFTGKTTALKGAGYLVSVDQL